MITREEFLKAVEVIRQYKAQLQEQMLEVQNVEDELPPNVNITRDTLIEDANMTVRLFNILHWNFYRKRENKTIGELENLSVSEFLSFRNSGRKTLQQLQELCAYAGIQLKQG